MNIFSESFGFLWRFLLEVVDSCITACNDIFIPWHYVSFSILSYGELTPVLIATFIILNFCDYFFLNVLAKTVSRYELKFSCVFPDMIIIHNWACAPPDPFHWLIEIGWASFDWPTGIDYLWINVLGLYHMCALFGKEEDIRPRGNMKYQIFVFRLISILVGCICVSSKWNSLPYLYFFFFFLYICKFFALIFHGNVDRLLNHFRGLTESQFVLGIMPKTFCSFGTMF